jgi:hypothetical protein
LDVAAHPCKVSADDTPKTSSTCGKPCPSWIKIGDRVFPEETVRKTGKIKWFILVGISLDFPHLFNALSITWRGILHVGTALTYTIYNAV